METGYSKVSGHREQSKCTVLGTRRSGDGQIRIYVLNITSDEELIAVGNQLSAPALLHVQKSSKTKTTTLEKERNTKQRAEP